jgi:hypothetical protein
MPDAGPPAQSQPASRPPLDVTFLVASDSHFGFGAIEAVHDRLVAQMNAMEEREKNAPRGVLITGDLTEWGRPEEWARFVEWYGLHGTEGHLRLPVFETYGNHDNVSGSFVRDRIAERHGGRFYSFDLDALHVVALGEAPDDEGLRFLERDLATMTAMTGRDTPIVLYFHLALSGPFSTGHWFGDGTFRDRLAALIADRNVLAIFHGHHHARGHYVWRGIDVYKPGAAKDGPHTFLVVHAALDHFSVTWRDADNGGAVVDRHEKRIRTKGLKIGHVEK